MTGRHDLRALLHPESVAIIGASDTPSRIGGRPLHFLLNEHFAGRVYPINPNRDTVQGAKSYRSIADLPEVVDSAIVAVPAAIAVDAVRSCIEAGVKSAIIFSSGFAEMSEEGERAQAEIESMVRASAMRAIGPNCLGAFTVSSGWYATFANAPSMLRMPPGPVGIVTQSGAYGTHVFVAAQQRRIGINYWVTTGNECDVDVAEVIDFYAEAPDVEVIMAYAEGMRDAERIRRALEHARDAGKPVIFQKVGRSAVGAIAAASHTASLAGSDAVYEALFRQHGVYRARTTEEMVDVAYACQFGRFVRGRKMSVQTISGGVGVQMADAAEEYALDVAPLPDALQRKLKQLLPFASVRNPVDFTAQVFNEPALMSENLRLTVEEADFDAHIIYLAAVATSPLTRELCLEVLTTLRREHPDELILLSLCGGDDVIPLYEAMDYPCFPDPDMTVRALAALAHFGEVFARRGPPPPLPAPADMLPVPPTLLAEHEAKRVLASAGIPVTRERLATRAEDAVRIWREIDGPVALKIASVDITHKTEIGGVALDIDDPTHVAETFDSLVARARAARPDARIDGVIVSEMAPRGIETVIGVVRDPVFGPAVMFGLGGILVEILADVSFRLAPFGTDEAARMIGEIKGRAVLDGVRGAPPSNVDALAEALSRLSVLAAANADRIESIDINPLVVTPERVVAVDALIVPRSDGDIAR